MTPFSSAWCLAQVATEFRSPHCGHCRGRRAAVIHVYSMVLETRSRRHGALTLVPFMLSQTGPTEEEKQRAEEQAMEEERAALREQMAAEKAAEALEEQARLSMELAAAEARSERLNNSCPSSGLELESLWKLPTRPRYRQWSMPPPTTASLATSAARHRYATEAPPPHHTFVHEGGGVKCDDILAPRVYHAKQTAFERVTSLKRSASYDSRLSAMAIHGTTPTPPSGTALGSSVPRLLCPVVIGGSGQSSMQRAFGGARDRRAAEGDAVLLRSSLQLDLKLPPRTGGVPNPLSPRVPRAQGGDLPRPGYRPASAARRPARRPRTVSSPATIGWTIGGIEL